MAYETDVNIVLEVLNNVHSLMCPTDRDGNQLIDHDGSSDHDGNQHRGSSNRDGNQPLNDDHGSSNRDGNQPLNDDHGSSNRDGNRPLHGNQWTLVQNPRRALKKENGVIKD
jgi:hypothetical protein